MPGWGSPGAKIQHRVTAGQVFGQLTVLDPNGRKSPTPGQVRRGKPGTRAALCRCSCGQETLADIYQLLSGDTTSCGCGRINRMRERDGNRTHGLARHPLYSTWFNMLQRCENPDDKNYPYYGARGIRVCDRWHDVAVFIADIERWLGSRPARMTLDRIFNDHDYRLDNVRWASRAEQSRNRRSSSDWPALAG
jgi:hypothetical protein